VPKLYRTTQPPAGYDLPPRNVRLYGSKDEQIATAALRARGCPSPDRAYVPSRRRTELAAAREQEGHMRRLQRAQTAMLEAQRAVRRAKSLGQDYGHLARASRDARREYLRLTGGTERRAVEAPIAPAR
jgi:hypothetical protein